MARAGRAQPLSTLILVGGDSDLPGEDHFGTGVLNGGGYEFYVATQNRVKASAVLNGGGTWTGTGGRNRAGSGILAGGGSWTGTGHKSIRRIKVFRVKRFGPMTYAEIFGDTPPITYRDE